MRVPYSLNHRNQRGDTIVEVVIAIAVISSVLTGAFYLTNHSTRAVRDAQEHAQALQLLQGQVEQLRAQAPDNTWSALPANFCFDNATGAIKSLASSTTYGCNAADYYNFVIERPPTPPANGENALFKVKVQWDSILSKKGNETLLYKVPLKP